MVAAETASGVIEVKKMIGAICYGGSCLAYAKWRLQLMRKSME